MDSFDIWNKLRIKLEAAAKKHFEAEGLEVDYVEVLSANSKEVIVKRTVMGNMRLHEQIHSIPANLLNS